MNIVRVTDPLTALLSKPFIASLDQYYPDISNWYHYRIVNELNDSNCILLHAYQNEKLVGVSIAKKGIDPKLRCVRISKELESSGLGIKLINRTLDEMETDKPMVTVSEELFHQYSRAFHHYYDFKIEQVLKGLYRENKLEYIYNGNC